MIRRFSNLVAWRRIKLVKTKRTRSVHGSLDVSALEDRVLLSASPIDLAMEDVDIAVTHDGLDAESLVGLTAMNQDCLEIETPFDVGDLSLVHDDFHVDDFGNLFDVYPELPLLEADLSESEASPSATGSSVTLSETFLLHSNPGAAHTIYLDFDGHVTSGTQWNDVYTNGEDFVSPAYDQDGDPNSFSDFERREIQYIWQQVAEDFIPFDVNVTTQDPGAGALINNGEGDTEWGVRAVIGGSGLDWYGWNTGGVGLYTSFNWSYDAPVFVFDPEGNLAATVIAETTSHEVGHSLGLGHDGSVDPYRTYYPGHGSGETSWAPIMGGIRQLTQWTDGDYPNSNNNMDELAIITSENGFGYRTDDHGDDSNTASLLSISGNDVSDAGIIEQNTDFDVFTFTTDGGLIDLNIDTIERGPNLDILAELRDANYNLIQSSNPLYLLDAVIQAEVAAGQYFLVVTGTGQDDPNGYGYSDYGSLGQYFISGTIGGTSGSSLAISATNAVAAEGDAGNTELTFTVNRTGDTSVSTSVDFAVTGSGVNPAQATDFVNAVLPAGTLTFAAGETTKTISVFAIGDLDVEADEAFTVTLSNATPGAFITTAQAAGTILNDDAPLDTSDSVSIAATDATKSEGDAGSTAFTFTITRTGYTADSTSVSYAVTGSGVDAAQAGDFAGGSLPSGNVVFAAGENSKTITVQVAGDVDVEGNEGFTVTLNNAAGDTLISGSQAAGTILNDDVPPAAAGITVTPVSGLVTNEDEAMATFTVVLDSRPEADVTVQVTSMDTTEGTVDFSTLTFTSANWNVAQNVNVHGVDDDLRDGNVGYTVRLAAAQSADGNYHGIDPDDVGLTNQDNEKGNKGNGNGGGGNGKGKGGPHNSSTAEASALESSIEQEFTDYVDAETVSRENLIEELVRAVQPEYSEGKVAVLDFARAPHGARAVTPKDGGSPWPEFHSFAEFTPGTKLGSALRSLYAAHSPDDWAEPLSAGAID